MRGASGEKVRVRKTFCFGCKKRESKSTLSIPLPQQRRRRGHKGSRGRGITKFAGRLLAVEARLFGQIHDLAVDHVHVALGAGGEFGVMGDHDDGGAFRGGCLR